MVREEVIPTSICYLQQAESIEPRKKNLVGWVL